MTEDRMDTVLDNLLSESGELVVKSEKLQQQAEDLRELVEDICERLGIAPEEPEGSVPLYSLKPVVGRLRAAFDEFTEGVAATHSHLSPKEQDMVDEHALFELTTALENLEDLCS